MSGEVGALGRRNSDDKRMAPGKGKEGTSQMACALWVVRSTSAYWGIVGRDIPFVEVVSEVREIGLGPAIEVRHISHAPAAGEVSFYIDMPYEITVGLCGSQDLAEQHGVGVSPQEEFHQSPDPYQVT